MKRGYWILVLVLGIWGCSKVAPVPIVPEFKTISAEEMDLVLQANGSGELPFVVEDSLYHFNYDVSSPECQISLRLTGGKSPEYFELTSIEKGDSAGRYVAKVKDNGKELLYKEGVSLAMTFKNEAGKDVTVTSSPFVIESESSYYGGIVIKTGLPIVTIETKDSIQITSKERYVDATIKISGIGLYDNFETSPCHIRGRGNSTWCWPKKPYLIKFDNRVEVLGMPKHKRWVLLANFMDRTMMRNIVAYKVSSLTSLEWTPKSVPVEVVLNGEHIGNYLLIEQVRVDKNRVNITEMTPNDISGEELTGGYLLELDFHDDNTSQWLVYYGSCYQYPDAIPFALKSPDEDMVVPQQLEWIKNYTNVVSEVIYSDNFADPVNGYAKYLDLQSFADYWLIYELMGNHELGNPGSVYMHKDRGGKLVAGPAWDFDWGALSYNTSPKAKTDLINYSSIWYAQLMKDPNFRKLVKERWKVLRPQFQTVPAFIEQQETLLSRSATLNFAMWNPAEDASLNGGYIINGDENMNFHDAVARLKTIFQERITVMDRAIAKW